MGGWEDRIRRHSRIRMRWSAREKFIQLCCQDKEQTKQTARPLKSPRFKLLDHIAPACATPAPRQDCVKQARAKSARRAKSRTHSESQAADCDRRVLRRTTIQYSKGSRIAYRQDAYLRRYLQRHQDLPGQGQFPLATCGHHETDRTFAEE